MFFNVFPVDKILRIYLGNPEVEISQSCRNGSLGLILQQYGQNRNIFGAIFFQFDGKSGLYVSTFFQ